MWFSGRFRESLSFLGEKGLFPLDKPKKWIKIKDAPFAIRGIAGDNVHGIVAYGGEGEDTQAVAYIPNYRGDWVHDDRLRAPAPVKALGGNNRSGPVVLNSAGDTFYVLTNYGAPVWTAIPIQGTAATTIAGENQHGIVILTNE